MNKLLDCRLLWRNTKGAATVEFAVVLVVLSISIWLTIGWINNTIVNYINSVAISYGAAATSNLPKMAAPDSTQ
jgi:Flp pilus assembly pilin Flp